MNTNSNRLAAVLCALAIAGVGCGQRRPEYDRAFHVSGPLGLDHRLYFVDHSAGEIVALEPGSETRPPAAIRQPICAPAERVVPFPDRRGLAVLCPAVGRVAMVRDDPELVSVQVLDLPAPLGRLALSEDAAFALAFHDPERPLDEDVFFSNPNEVALLDLRQEPPVVERMDLPDSGDQPRRVWFSPELSGGSDRARLAVVATRTSATVLDLLEPQVGVTTIRLSADASSPREPVEALFGGPDVEPGGEVLFLRLAGSSDVYGVHRTPAGAGRTQPAYAVNIHSTSFTGSTEDAELLYSAAGAPRLLLVRRAEAAARVIDVASSTEVIVPLPEGVNRIQRIPASNGDRALLYRADGQSSSFYVLSVEGIEDRLARNVEEVVLSDRIGAVSPSEAGDLAVILAEHRRAVYLVDLVRPESSAYLRPERYEMTLAPDQVAVSPEGSTFLALKRSGPARLGSLPLGSDSRRPQSQTLDRPVEADGAGLILLPGAGVVAVDHGLDAGMVTLVPVDRIGDASAVRAAAGFMVRDLLDPR